MLHFVAHNGLWHGTRRGKDAWFCWLLTGASAQLHICLCRARRLLPFHPMSGCSGMSMCTQRTYSCVMLRASLCNQNMTQLTPAEAAAAAKEQQQCHLHIEAASQVVHVQLAPSELHTASAVVAAAVPIWSKCWQLQSGLHACRNCVALLRDLRMTWEQQPQLPQWYQSVVALSQD